MLLLKQIKIEIKKSLGKKKNKIQQNHYLLLETV